MIVNKQAYKPQAKQAAILARALELVNSVPYRVSSRWVFYQLFQQGWYTRKRDYSNKWDKAVSRARHAFYDGWTPYTLADETREIIRRGGGHPTPQAWLEALSERLECSLDKWQTQDYYVMLWFEARAMADQFRYYTQHIDLVPMAGQPSIPYKWELAKELERVAARYQKPIRVLYFGDLDTGGEIISDTVEGDVRKWCAVDFQYIRCGLTEEQVARYNVPENFEKPGDYQWEALPDAAAQAIISENLDRFVRHDAFSEIVSRETDVADWVRGELVDLIDQYPN